MIQRHAHHYRHDCHDKQGATQADEERVMQVGPSDWVFVRWQWVQRHETDCSQGENVGDPGKQVAISQLLPD